MYSVQCTVSVLSRFYVFMYILLSTVQYFIQQTIEVFLNMHKSKLRIKFSNRIAFQSETKSLFEPESHYSVCGLLSSV